MPCQVRANLYSNGFSLFSRTICCCCDVLCTVAFRYRIMTASTKRTCFPVKRPPPPQGNWWAASYFFMTHYGQEHCSPRKLWLCLDLPTTDRPRVIMTAPDEGFQSNIEKRNHVTLMDNYVTWITNTAPQINIYISDRREVKIKFNIF